MIELALTLLMTVSNNDYCMYEVGCFRYNCADFTKDGVLLLRENNYTAYPMLGWYNHAYHSWIGVEINGTLINIEPQTGEVVYPGGEEYKRGRRGIVRGLY